jgi:hypothetical protein
MQIVKGNNKTRSHRPAVIACLVLAYLVFMAFDVFQGRSAGSYEDYVVLKDNQGNGYDADADDDGNDDEPSTSKSTPTPTPPQVSQESIDAAVAAGVAAALAAQPLAPAPATATTPRHDFRELGKKTGTDKAAGYDLLQKCQEDKSTCTNPNSERETCRTGGHFYDIIYEKWLAPYTSGDNPMQLLEIGFYTGSGFETFTNFLSDNKAAELHSMEISCLEHGPREEGKWPWGNPAENHTWYIPLRKAQRLHCGDSNNF